MAEALVPLSSDDENDVPSKEAPNICGGVEWAPLISPRTYLTGRHRVQVAILGAVGLPSLLCSNGPPDSYCMCEVIGKPRSRVMSDVAMQVKEPIWNCNAQIEDFAPEDVLEFSVFARRPWPSTDALVGKARLSGASILALQRGGNVPLVRDFSGSDAFSDDASSQAPVLRVQISVRTVATKQQFSWSPSEAEELRGDRVRPATRPLGAAASSVPSSSLKTLPEDAADEKSNDDAESAPRCVLEALAGTAWASSATVTESDAPPGKVCTNTVAEAADANESESPVLSASAAGAHFHDGEVLLSMLGNDGEKSLTRRDARTWFRSLGWCFDDAALDSILDEALADTNAEPSSEPPRWELPTLVAAAERYRDLCGPDPHAVRSALQLLAGCQGKGGTENVSRETLRARATQFENEGGLSAADFDELLELCGVPLTAKSLRLESIASSIVDTICHPRAQCMNQGPRRAARATSQKTRL
eukprot:TRINITY_DN74274_c0_g1_i1.p1 TRINITY_DN74274_c0_g1~~TRINITY_DN74274_c0_g1_i1.p1  ORF type:complete len:475 (-),score=75.17 TRINITY_DN74274_c0_g1_i1:115-1539(-)